MGKISSHLQSLFDGETRLCFEFSSLEFLNVLVALIVSSRKKSKHQIQNINKENFTIFNPIKAQLRNTDLHFYTEVCGSKKR